MDTVGDVYAGRPLVIDDAYPLDHRSMEFEVGFEYSVEVESFNEYENNFPLSLTYGLYKGIELNVGTSFLNTHPEIGNQVDGFSDLSIAAKGKLLSEGRMHPAVALSTTVKIPTADKEKGLTNGDIEYDIHFIFSKIIGNMGVHFSIGRLFLGTQEEEGAKIDLKDVTHGGIAFDYLLNENTQLVAETHGGNSPIEDEPISWFLGSGIRYSISESFILDSLLSTMVSPVAGSDIFATIGITYVFN